MVLFPIGPSDDTNSEPASPWKIVEARQKQPATEWWLVPQPAHAALSGDMAAALREDLFGAIDETIARCIALHDAGWSMDDAQQIERLRANNAEKPEGFIEAAPPRFLRAWTASIETAQKFAPIGGYLVSRHFERISQREDTKNQRQLEAFRKAEQARQKKLRASLSRNETELEKLVDALQFCDLLSLYLCCGARQSARFTKPAVTVSRSGDEYRLEPSPFRGPQQLSFSALRHPAQRGKGKSSAVFYVNV